jgi:hypothetical protein
VRRKGRRRHKHPQKEEEAIYICRYIIICPFRKGLDRVERGEREKKILYGEREGERVGSPMRGD